MACKGCKGKGATPFCAWCFCTPIKKKRLTAEEHEKLAKEKDREAVLRARVRFQEQQLGKMIFNIEKVNGDASGVQYLLDQNI